MHKVQVHFAQLLVYLDNQNFGINAVVDPNKPLVNSINANMVNFNRFGDRRFCKHIRIFTNYFKYLVGLSTDFARQFQVNSSLRWENDNIEFTEVLKTCDFNSFNHKGSPLCISVWQTVVAAPEIS